VTRLRLRQSFSRTLVVHAIWRKHELLSVSANAFLGSYAIFSLGIRDPNENITQGGLQPRPMGAASHRGEEFFLPGISAVVIVLRTGLQVDLRI
jgi:hypothetical protein